MHSKPVRPDWIDLNGPIGMACYLLTFDQASETLHAFLALYRRWLPHRLTQNPDLLERPLRGKDPVCRCPHGGPCHADVLLGKLQAIEDSVL